METITPPKKRLFELKSSAEFSSSEFSHSIKTWVNMASLLIKQGNMAESNKDDENAYISYVRACLIITKIIPFQPNYPAMMNDIVCTDLRQKILLVVTRIGHLERRLLKQFEQENQELIQRQSLTTQEPVTEHYTYATTPSISLKQQRASMDETDRESEREASMPFQEVAPEEREEEQDEQREPEDQEKQDEEDSDIEQDVRRLRMVPETDADLALDLNPRTYASHYQRRSIYRRSRDLLQEQQFQGHDEKKVLASSHLTSPATGSLRKKSSNEEHRSFLSPECQPNNSNATVPSSQDYPSFASARHQHLFAQHPHRGGHVRRCSSTDGLRTRMHIPGHNSPAIPPRSDKRSSMMASVAQYGSGNPNPSRPSLAELRAGDRSNRRTMSFEITWTLPHEQRKGLPAAIMTSTPRQSVDISHGRSISVNNNSNNESTDSAPSSASTTGSSSSPSTAQSTPVASPQLKISPQMGNSLHSFHGYGHGYSASLTSITSASTLAATMVDGTTPSPTRSMGLPPPLAPPSISSCSMHSTSTVTTPITPVASPILASSSTISSISASTMVNPPSVSSHVSTGSGTWATTGKKAGLLRKIRSKPKLKDQLFDILPNLQFISDSVRDIEPAGLEEDIGDCLQEEHSIQLEIFRLLAKQ
ncbi:hypothetical protein BGZ59_011475 [Podila verticillata]|nr:hypothetical protein BGZ59_011475 [Podila verticillata]